MNSVTLISPAPECFDTLRHSNRLMTKLQVLPRLSLLALEAATPPGWDVRILDERVNTIVPHDIDSPLVGITTMTYMAPRAFALARALKALGKTVCWVGFSRP